MALDVRTAQNSIENALRDAVLYALGKRLPQLADVTALRAFVSQGATGSNLGDDELVLVTATSTSYRWSKSSTAADNGTTIIKPDDAGANGRWLSWTSPLRFASSAGNNSAALHELTSGPLQRVILLDRDAEVDLFTQLLQGDDPCVGIDAGGDRPSDQAQNTGHKYDVEFDFTVYVVAKNLRDRREAAQGYTGPSPVDFEYGANRLDGMIWSLLGGTQMFGVLDGIKNVRVGAGDNWTSELAQRRVIRSRNYTVVATVENSASPNDAGEVQKLVGLHQPAESNDQTADIENYVVDGIFVPWAALGVGLSKSILAGTAYIDGDLVTYAGQVATFTADTDTYRDLLPNGTLAFTEVPVGGTAPLVTATAMRIGYTRSNADGLEFDKMLVATKRDPP